MNVSATMATTSTKVLARRVSHVEQIVSEMLVQGNACARKVMFGSAKHAQNAQQAKYTYKSNKNASHPVE
jgi:methyl coenzyme M reductase subunit D